MQIKMILRQFTNPAWAKSKSAEKSKWRSKKAEKSISGAVSLIYWLVATAVFLICTFGPTGNRQPQSYWIIWAVAGVLYGAVMAGMRLVKGSGK